MELKKINANIARVRANSAKLNELIQSTAVGCIEHAMAHGDAEPAKNLVAAMPKSIRRAALVNWFTAYSPINITSNKGELKCSLRKNDAKAYTPFNVDGARANNWYEMPELDKEDIPTSLADLNDGVINLVKRMEKRLADNKVVEGDRAQFEAKLALLKKMEFVAAA